MELILRSDNESSIAKIVDLATSLNIPLDIQDNVSDDKKSEQLKEYLLHFKAIGESSFGDPVEWQRETRKDRDLPFSPR